MTRFDFVVSTVRKLEVDGDLLQSYPIIGSFPFVYYSLLFYLPFLAFVCAVRGQDLLMDFVRDCCCYVGVVGIPLGASMLDLAVLFDLFATNRVVYLFVCLVAVVIFLFAVAVSLSFMMSNSIDERRELQSGGSEVDPHLLKDKAE